MSDVDQLIKSLYGEPKCSITPSESPEYTSMRQGLGCLGLHPLLLKYALLELKASGENMKSIDEIKNFPLLMYVDISNNEVSDLDTLHYLPTLVQLNARGNKLSQCLNFAPPKCTADNSWSSGHKAMGSMLVRADLSNNEIHQLDDLAHHPFLECLLLSMNRISAINGLQSLRYLQVLDLSKNKISQISGLDGLPIQELNLSGNLLTTLEGLSELPYLSSLDVSDNQISVLSPLASCVQLHFLDIHANKLEQIRQVEFLRDLPWLRVLNLMDTPASLKHYYRLRVVYVLSSLSELDRVAVSAEEKILAMNFRNDESGDNEHRAMTFDRFFPNSFIPDAVLSDTLNAFVDDELDLSPDDLTKDLPNLEAYNDPNEYL